MVKRLSTLICVLKGYYYFAIIEDLLLRLTWTLTVTIGEGEVINSEILKTVVASLEVFRSVVLYNFVTV